MLQSLLRLNKRLNVLFLPSAPTPIANLDLVRHHAVELYNKASSFPDQLFAFANRGIADDVGYDNFLFGRLAALLVGDQVARRAAPWLDFKAFSINTMAYPEPRLTQRDIVRDADDSKFLQQCIERWCAEGVREYFSVRIKKRVFRRSLIIGFVTEFDQFYEYHTSGHQITIAFEITEQKIFRLYVIEYRMHEYVYNIHGRLFQFMANAIRSYEHFDERVHLITNRMICLKGRMQMDNGFMMCMSISYRVSTMLSYVEDLETMREEDGDFESSRRFLMHHTFTMLNWFLRNEDVAQKRLTVLVCKEMVEDYYEMRKDLCFLLAPFEDPKRDRATRVWYDVDQQVFKFDKDGEESEECLAMVVFQQ